MKKFGRFLIFGVLSVLLILQTISPVFAAGTSQKNATSMNVSEIVYDSIDAKGESDWYKITTEDKDAYYYFALKQESLTNGMLYVYSSRGEEMLKIGNQYSSGGASYTGNVRLEKSSAYYVKVTTVWEKYTGTYNIQYSYVEDTVGDRKDCATSINLNEEYESGIDGSGDCDWFCIEPTVTCDYKVVLAQASLTNAKLYVYTDRDEELLSIGHQYSNAGSKYDGVVSLSAGNKYYIKVTTVWEEYIGEYFIIVSQCANGHTPSDAWVTTKEPTCTEVGEKTKYCSVCNEILETKQVDAKGHSLGEWKIRVPATLLSLGENEAECEICGAVETGKDWSQIWILPAIAVVVIFILIYVAKRKAAKAREARRAEEERNRYLAEEKQILLREKKYKDATSKKTINEQLMWEAAKLGNEQACIYVGTNFIRRFSSGMLTNSEKASKAAELATMLKIFEQGYNPTGEFLLLYFTCIADKIDSKEEAHAGLQSLRDIIDSQEIPVWLVPHIESAIKMYVEWIDNYCEPARYSSYGYSNISSYGSTPSVDDSPYPYPTATGWTDNFNSSTGTYVNGDGMTVQLDSGYVVDENGYMHLDVSDM